MMKKVLILVCLLTMLVAPAIVRADGPSWDREGTIGFLAGATATLTVTQTTSYVTAGESRKTIKEWPVGVKMWAMKPFTYALTDPGGSVPTVHVDADTTGGSVIYTAGGYHLTDEYPVVVELWTMPASILVTPASSDTIWYVERFAD